MNCWLNNRTLRRYVADRNFPISNHFSFLKDTFIRFHLTHDNFFSKMYPSILLVEKSLLLNPFLNDFVRPYKQGDHRRLLPVDRMKQTLRVFAQLLI